MLVTCTRCGTEMPDDAIYCPYCNLHRSKHALAEGAEKNSEDPSREREAKSPVVPKRPPGNQNRATGRKRNRSTNIRLRLVILAAVVAISGVGFYVFVLPVVNSQQAEPATVLAALDKLKRMPSDEPGLTIDARLVKELDRSRKNGNLVGYQGWNARSAQGTRTTVVLAFSFQEAGNINQSAEWIADLTTGTFTPQTELATAVSRQ